MKAIKITLAGRERHLVFTGEAMFRIQDEWGGSSALLEAIQPNSREGFQTACRAAAILAEQGELARRYFGYDPEPMVDAEAIAQTTTPDEIETLKLAIPAALTLGYGREVAPENEEIDVVLLELNQKKTT